MSPGEQPEHAAPHGVQTDPPARFEHRSSDGWRGDTLQPGGHDAAAGRDAERAAGRDTMEVMAIGLDPASLAASFGEAVDGHGVRVASVG